jgi:hypothetical protein
MLKNPLWRGVAFYCRFLGAKDGAYLLLGSWPGGQPTTELTLTNIWVVWVSNVAVMMICPPWMGAVAEAQLQNGDREHLPSREP